VTQLDHRAVMQYYDGELPPAEAQTLEWRLAADPELRGVLSGLEQIGAVVAAVAEARAAAAEDIADAVMRRVGADVSGVRPRLMVAGGGCSAARLAEPRSPRGLRRPWIVAAGLAAVSVAAAAACIAFYGTTEREAERPILALSARPSDWAARAQPYLGSAELRPSGSGEAVAAVAIESVDFGSRNGAIFMVPGDAVATPVVWLVDEPAETGDRMDLP